MMLQRVLFGDEGAEGVTWDSIDLAQRQDRHGIACINGLDANN